LAQDVQIYGNRTLNFPSSPVLLFKRILSSNKAPDTPADKRKAKRYTVGAYFPFKSVLTLMAHDEDGNLIEDGGRSQAWGGRLTDLSETGANIQLNAAAIARRGEACSFKLSVDDYVLEFPCTIAHFRTYPQHVSCGFSFNFPNPDVLRAYMQVLEPVAIGASLTAVKPDKVVQDTSGLTKEQYQGNAGALLTVWKRPSSTAIYSFDFRMNAYGVRWSEGMTEVEPYGLSKLNLEGKKTASPFVHLTDHELDDVRWLFCLAVPNLAKAVPLEVRKFLTALVA
jgi:PilZ domain